MKTSVNSADKVLEFKVKKEEVVTEIIEQASKEASDVMEEINAKEKEEEEELSSLTSAMENLVSIKPARVRGGAEEEKTKVEIELENIDSYHAVRVKKLKEEILVKMEYHKDELKAKWRDQKDFFKGPIGKKYYLHTIIDQYSMFPIVESCTSTSWDQMEPMLENALSLLGDVEKLTLDGGPPYDSREFTKFAKRRGGSSTTFAAGESPGEWVCGGLPEGAGQDGPHSCHGEKGPEEGSAQVLGELQGSSAQDYRQKPI